PDIPGVTIRDTDIHDSTYDGIQFKTGGGALPDVTVDNVRIDGSVNGCGVLAMSGARGSATLTDVTITGSAEGDVCGQPGSQFDGRREGPRDRSASARGRRRPRAVGRVPTSARGREAVRAGAPRPPRHRPQR